MKYYVSIHDQEFEIDIWEEGDALKALLNGRTYDMDPAVIEEGSKYSVIIRGESFNVTVNRNSGMDIIVGGHLYQAEVLDERERGARALEKSKGGRGHQIIQSVMPGIVRRVFVSEGDRVSPGKPLLILEAMKMENELCAESDGRVSRIHIFEGQTVNSSDPLVTLD